MAVHTCPRALSRIHGTSNPGSGCGKVGPPRRKGAHTKSPPARTEPEAIQVDKADGLLVFHLSLEDIAQGRIARCLLLGISLDNGGFLFLIPCLD